MWTAMRDTKKNVAEHLGEVQGTSKWIFTNTGPTDHHWTPYHHGKLQHNGQ